MAACYLLSKKPQPKSEDIREGLSGNLCRCTGYAQICEAVSEAAAVDNAKRKNATGVND
jgi:carbon-monoxide dehydrogenase small subunit